jgi:hypothetical protein
VVILVAANPSREAVVKLVPLGRRQAIQKGDVDLVLLGEVDLEQSLQSIEEAADALFVRA